MICKICGGKLWKIPKERHDTLVVYSCTKCGRSMYEILDKLFTRDDLYKMEVSRTKDEKKV